ncbi:HlyD family secretion protein [Actinoplanes sp. OR16]|uniref:HlyD family efflux transporter periplasmic adaptor subunit n=1 Tax=Actinoplanes sp. OR16 TaxID=946334 RepID=UPI00135F1A0A|nr:HlyD family secretion protein [Actinoplanes sp. OR16]
MSATTDSTRTFDDSSTKVIQRPEPAAPPPERRGRGRAVLRVMRTGLVVLILVTVAGAGGAHVVRQRLAEQNMVDAGTAVLTAQPITAGSADAAVVTEVLTTERTSVAAGAVLATITLTADGEGPRVQKLRAPAAGVITRIDVAAGQVARAGEPIVTLYDPAKVAFAVDVPLEKLRRFRLGMTAYVTGPGLPGRITTTLEKVEPKVDAGRVAGGADELTVVLKPDPAARATVRTLVPGLRFAVVVDTTTAVGSTPAVNSA